jgi:hypothetical protein
MKYMKILLRLADLMDITRDRVNFDLLNQHYKFMSKESQFHWISHYAISGCDFVSQYRHNELKKDIYLEDHSLVEKFTIKLFVNAKLLKSLTCKKCEHQYATREDAIIHITIGEKKECKICYYICRWMMLKNKYLFDELNALLEYSRTNPNNLFKSEFEVQIVPKDDGTFRAELLDVINEKVDKPTY